MEEQKEFKKVKAPIIGADGNVFNLIGICQKQLRNAGYIKEAKELSDRVLRCGLYQEALAIMEEYVIPTSINCCDEEM